MAEVIVYRYRGDVERIRHKKPYQRGRNLIVRWSPGYSPDSEGGGVIYPWLTRRECQKEARNQGCIARCVR